MIYELPIFRQIRIASELTPNQKWIWCNAIDHLDVVEPRKIPWIDLERVMDIDRTTLIRAANVLASHGFLCKDARDGSSALWRVPLSRAAIATVDESPNITEVQHEHGVTPHASARTPRVRKLSKGVF